jgi:hypothetical protein
MNETKEHKETKAKAKPSTDAQTRPVHVVRQGALAASIWLRQSPSGYPYFDFSLSRSWKNVNTGRDGYSSNFFDRNRDDLIKVIDGATDWIAAQGLASDAREAA